MNKNIKITMLNGETFNILANYAKILTSTNTLVYSFEDSEGSVWSNLHINNVSSFTTENEEITKEELIEDLKNIKNNIRNDVMYKMINDLMTEVLSSSSDYDAVLCIQHFSKKVALIQDDCRDYMEMFGLVGLDSDF